MYTMCIQSNIETWKVLLTSESHQNLSFGFMHRYSPKPIHGFEGGEFKYTESD